MCSILSFGFLQVFNKLSEQALQSVTLSRPALGVDSIEGNHSITLLHAHAFRSVSESVSE